ncbi:MAG: 30S ribosomal protein S4 [Tenericutes bacterium]|nr:30S ribosomal protein S4 [Mycoplasmatota bacterium]MDD7630184.1 30S ribosomal protein S4 [bacterium]MDO4377349.1 30S ribosomal protein S4 [bacterium]MDY4108578.1 30S ribosomal protein S4 [Bacilli bacterium]
MSRYTGPAYKKSRRIGISALETGKELVKKPYGPGQHGNGRKGKLSNYGVQLVEKQKLRFTYGISEKQLRKIFEKAGKLKGIHGENMFKLLESRLDNIVYRMGIASTRRAARQFVNHGHVAVNGVKVDIPSFQVKPGDVVSVRENSKEHKAMKETLENITRNVDYVSFDKNKLEGTYIRYPERNELTSDINESLVVEFYNK